MKKTRISEAEWQVMNLLWRNSPLAAQDIVEHLEKQCGWHSRTIRTLIDRLVRKGALRAELAGKRYNYEPLITLEECVRQESQSFVARVFGGQPSTMLLNLVKETKLSANDIKELRKILKEKEK